MPGLGFATASGFVGIGKETVQGTPVVPTVYIPITAMSPAENPSYMTDEAMRGSAVGSYGRVRGQGTAGNGYEGPVFMDTVGYALKGIFGDETVTGTGSPYTHAFAVLNTGNLQPPSWTLTEYVGNSAANSTPQYPGFMFSSVAIAISPTALLTHTTQGTGFPSVMANKPTQTFSGAKVSGAYKTAVLINSVAATDILSATWTFTRTVNPQNTLNNSTNPGGMWAGPLGLSIAITAIYDAETYPALMRAGTTIPIDMVTTEPTSSNSLELHTSTATLTKADYKMDNSGYVQVDITADVDGNTTDAGASGGYSTAKATLINSIASAY